MTWWHENGQKKVESHVINGRPHGLATEWYADGQKKCEQNFVNGMRDVVGTAWHENGKEMETRPDDFNCPRSEGSLSLQLPPGYKVASVRITPEATTTAKTTRDQITTTVTVKTSASDLKRMDAMVQESIYCGD